MEAHTASEVAGEMNTWSVLLLVPSGQHKVEEEVRGLGAGSLEMAQEPGVNPGRPITAELETTAGQS